MPYPVRPQAVLFAAPVASETPCCGGEWRLVGQPIGLVESRLLVHHTIPVCGAQRRLATPLSTPVDDTTAPASAAAVPVADAAALVVDTAVPSADDATASARDRQVAAPRR